MNMDTKWKLAAMCVGTLGRIYGVGAVTFGVFCTPKYDVVYIGMGLFICFGGTLLVWEVLGWYDFLWERIPFLRNIKDKTIAGIIASYRNNK